MANVKHPECAPVSSSHNGLNGTKQLHVYFDGQSHNILQQTVVNGLRDHMRERNAIVQEKPSKDTNLIVTTAKMGEDVPVQDLVFYRYKWDIDRYQTKVASVATTKNLPTRIEDIKPDHLAKVLDVPETNSTEELIDLAYRRQLSPLVAIGYPQIALVGCSYALIVEGDEVSDKPTSAVLVGLEQSHPWIDINGGFYADLFDKLEPQATAQMAIANTVSKIALPYDIWLNSTGPDEVIAAGKSMQELGMYPPPFPYRHFVSFLKRQFYDHFLHVTGLSYGNTSRRAEGKDAAYGLFWMSKSGVKKDELHRAEVFLVSGLSPETNEMVRTKIDRIKQSGRTSVDSTEIEQIYRAFERVRLTIHGHQWLIDPDTGKPLEQFDGFRKIGNFNVVCTNKQYPCGSVQLGRETVRAIDQSPNRAQTIVVQKRHGMQVTGDNYEETFGELSSLRDQGLLTVTIPQD